MHFACLKVVLTRMNLTQVWRIPQMESFCSTRINLTAMASYFTCSASFEWYPRQMQPWPVPWKMIVYTQEQFLECNRKQHVTTQQSWVFLQASCWRNKCFSFSSRHKRKSFWKPYRRKYFFNTNMTFSTNMILYRTISKKLGQQEVET